MAGIENVTKILRSAVAAANAADALAHVNYALVLEEMLDADEGELKSLAAEIGVLDLSNDELEAKIKAAAAAGHEPILFILRILRLVFPKKPVPVVA